MKMPETDEIAYADLHIHGRYARGCSKNLDIRKVHYFGRIKGLHLIGVGDILHLKWLEHAGEVLKEVNEGIYRVKGSDDGPLFVFSGEVALKDENGKNTHWVVVLPGIEAAETLREEVKERANLEDGRAIIELSPKDFIFLLKDTFGKDFIIFPAHIWTPYFGIFGSKVGYSSLKEILGEEALRYVKAIETGLSSDPEMNYYVRELHELSIVSFSDAHSFWPHRLGREATAFTKDVLEGFKNLKNAFSHDKILFTIEVPPEYGKYHYDGHRKCNFYVEPQIAESRYKNTCPVCGKPLTLGVLHRVYDLKDVDPKKEEIPRFFKVLPLAELTTMIYGGSPTAKKVLDLLLKVNAKFGGEYNALLFSDLAELKKELPDKLAEVIVKMRNNALKIRPGYDGVYGELILDEKDDKKEIKKHVNLLDFIG